MFFLKIFDTRVLPIMSYGSEVWGLYPAADICENVHFYAMKKNFNVSLRTPNDFMYKEIDRYPIITIVLIINCIRYWLKVLTMDVSRLPKKAYLFLLNMDTKGKKCWATYVRNCLSSYGFGFVWDQQGVGDVKSFLAVLKQRMIDVRWQNWNAHVNESERFDVYRSFCCSSKIVPKYINMNINGHIKALMTKFRFGVSNISTHFYRYRQHNERDLLCPMCKLDIENEVHFLLCCPFLNDLRVQYIPTKFYRTPI